MKNNNNYVLVGEYKDLNLDPNANNTTWFVQTNNEGRIKNCYVTDINMNADYDSHISTTNILHQILEFDFGTVISSNLPIQTITATKNSLCGFDCSNTNMIINHTKTNLSCFNNNTGSININVTGGQSPYTYHWSSGHNTQNIANLSAGNYIVTVYDNNYCEAVKSVTIDQPTDINLLGNITNTQCDNGAVSMTITGGVPPYNLQWSNGLIGNNISGLLPNTYTVTVTDANGCKKINPYTISLLAHQGDFYVTTSQTWTTQNNPFMNIMVGNTIVFNGNIIVNQGVDLKIIGLKFQFFPNKNVTLKAGTNLTGSKLTLNNSILTANNCRSNYLWRGVILEGNYSSQYPIATTKQPSLYMTNNSFIENAEMGAEARAGAIVIASNSWIRNNVIGVKFDGFNSNIAPYQMQNASSFTKCNFVTDSWMYLYPNGNPSYPNVHVHMWNVNGIKFNYNTFANNATAFFNTWKRGIGIQSAFSAYKIESSCSVAVPLGGECPSNYTLKNKFINLYYGIKAEAGSYITIDKAEFSNNFRGAYIKAINGTTVTRCNFDVEHNQTDTTYGLYLHGCYTIKVQENNFNNGLAGLFVNHADANHENKIYKNVFNNLNTTSQAVAATALKKNSDNGDWHVNNTSTGGYYGYGEYGLEFRCNTFTNNNYHISVINGNIQKNQGENTQNINTKPAGNTFVHSCVNGNNDFYIYNSDITKYNYYYHYNNPSTDLVCYTNSKIDKFSVPVSYNQSACPSKLTNTTPRPTYRNLELLIKEYNDIISLNQNELKYIDNGNTVQLIENIKNVTPSGFNDLCNTLRSTKYLSDEVIKEFISVNINEQFNKKTDVLVKHSPLPVSIKPLIAEFDYPQHFIDLIQNAQVGMNSREIIEGEIKNATNQKQELINDYYFECLNNDSIPIDKDSLIIVLNKETNYLNKIKQIELMLVTNHTDVLVKLDELKNNLPNLSATRKAEILNWIALKKIEYSSKNLNNEQFVGLVKNNRAFLEYIVATDKLGAEYAQIMLEQSKYEIYSEEITLPIIDLNNKNLFIDNNAIKVNDVISNVNDELNIYPNPANNSINISSNKKISNLAVYNNTGLKVLSINNIERNNLKIDITELPCGIYLINCDNNIKKFIITR